MRREGVSYRRYPRYPKVSLGTAAIWVEQLHRRLGRRSVPVRVLPDILGLPPTHVRNVVLPTLVEFGLLSREPPRGSNRVALTSLALDILRSSGEHRRSALRAAAGQPRIFQTIRELERNGLGESAQIEHLIRVEGLSLQGAATVLSAYHETHRSPTWKEPKDVTVVLRTPLSPRCTVEVRVEGPLLPDNWIDLLVAHLRILRRSLARGGDSTRDTTVRRRARRIRRARSRTARPRRRPLPS